MSNHLSDERKEEMLKQAKEAVHRKDSDFPPFRNLAHPAAVSSLIEENEEATKYADKLEESLAAAEAERDKLQLAFEKVKEGVAYAGRRWEEWGTRAEYSFELISEGCDLAEAALKNGAGEI